MTCLIPHCYYQCQTVVWTHVRPQPDDGIEGIVTLGKFRTCTQIYLLMAHTALSMAVHYIFSIWPSQLSLCSRDFDRL